MSKLKVALIFGGPSSEHEISIQSAKSVNRAINRQKYTVVLIGISKTGHWFTASTIEKAITKLSSPKSASEVAIVLDGTKPALIHLVDRSKTPIPLDIALPILHGTFGEDGQIQALFEICHLPYVGCDVNASVIGLDKAIQKTLLRAANIPVVDYLTFLRSDWIYGPKLITKNINQFFQHSYPLIVKPDRLGSSIGITKVSRSVQLADAINLAFKFDDKIIIETCLDHPREIELAILGNHNPTISVCGEIINNHEIYSYEAKYQDQTSQTIIPADIPNPISQKLQTTALQAYQILGCSGLARVDFFLDRSTSQFWLNEINTMPGFTKISMYPKLMEYSGVPLPQLIDQLIDLGLQRANPT